MEEYFIYNKDGEQVGMTKEEFDRHCQAIKLIKEVNILLKH